MATKKETNSNETITKGWDEDGRIRVMSGSLLSGRYLTDFVIWKTRTGIYLMRVRTYHSEIYKHYETVDEAVQVLVSRYGDWE